MALARQIVQIVRDRLPAADLSRVVSVRVDVGEFSGVVLEALAFGFESVVADSAMRGARLDAVPVPVGLQCRACSAGFRVAEPPFACPRCGTPDVEVVGGADVVVRSIELKEEGA